MNFNQVQKRNKLIKYFCLVTGLFIILYTGYEILKSDADLPETDLNKDLIKKPTNKKFSVSVQRPVFEGFGKDQKPYKVAADSISKKDDNNYLLNDIKGEYVTNKNKVLLCSKQGVFNSKSKELHLKNQVTVWFDLIELTSNDVHIDIENKNCYSDMPIIIKQSGSNIKADSFSSDKESSVIKLKGNVKSSIMIKKNSNN
ncbi:MAG: hypothetical protein DGJ47_000223 [Rickettsiaceae bacterium]